MFDNVEVGRIGRQWGWQLEDRRSLAAVTALANRGEPVAVYQDAGHREWWQALGGWPHHFERLAEWPTVARHAALLVISDRQLPPAPGPLAEAVVVFRPPTLTLGVTGPADFTADDLAAAVADLFDRNRLSPRSLTAVGTTADLANHGGLEDFCEGRQIPVLPYAPARLAALFPGGGAGAAAMLAAGVRAAVVPPTALGPFTLAVARRVITAVG
jgi:hypothetical protein